MRTAELIGLLRSHDRNKPIVRDHLAMLDQTRQLHLLGELSNWLLVELHKYQDRQTGPNDLETLQQGSIHSQIRHTLKAIIAVLQSVTVSAGTNGVNGRTNGTATTSSSMASTLPIDAKKQQPVKTALPMDDRAKDKILDSFLSPILIGLVPLGPRVNSMDVQHMCAKILNFCVNPLTANAPFPPQDFAKRMMSISASSSSSTTSSSGNNHSRAVPSMKPHRSGADVVQALSSLLKSSSIKLQEYGLRILTSHKFFVQERVAWDVLPALRSVLEALSKDLAAILAGSMSIFEPDQDIGDPLEANNAGNDVSGKSVDHQGKSDESSSPVGIRSRGLLLLQSFLTEAGRHTPPSALLQQQRQLQGSVKLERLQEAAPMSLLVKLWQELQQIFFFDKAALPSCDRMVLVLCGAIYWACWVFQEKESAMAVLLEEGMDTLLAWYGYYITSHDDVDQEYDTAEDKDRGPAAQTLGQQSTSRPAAAGKEDDLKHQASVLEYLTKLIVNLVSNKSNHVALYSGFPRPVGLTITRRTIEFFGDIPTTAVQSSTAGTATPTSTVPGPSSSSLPALPNNNSNNNNDNNDTAISSTSVQLIRLKPGILEAMLGVISGCFGANRASEDLIVYSRVPHVLVMLLSEPASRGLFGTPSKELPEATSRRFLHQSLNLLPGFLKHEGLNSWTENMNWNEWTVGYTALVNRVMLPLDQEAETNRTWIIESHMKGLTSDSPLVPQLTLDAEMGLKALKVFALFWKYHPKGRWLLSDIFGPRFFQYKILYVLADLRGDSFIANASTVGDWVAVKWIRERTLLLVDTAVYLGAESNIRFNMRERWGALPFLVALLGACVRRLNLREYSVRELHCRRIALKCFYALRHFWLDRQGLTQLVDLNLGPAGSEEEVLWWKSMPLMTKSFSAAVVGEVPGGSAMSASIVPLLLSILVPPKTEWSSDLLLGGIGKRSRWWHPLFEREEPLLVETCLHLAQISPLPTCQQRLVSKPGVIWMLSRMMVERSLVDASPTTARHRRHHRHKTDPVGGANANMPRELIEKSLFETLTKVMTSEESAKSVVSNNTTTELFAAILDVDQPLRFYRDKMVFESEPAAAATASAEEDEPPTDPLRAINLILPTRRHQNLQQQLLHHFQTVMRPLRGQFERIYQYVGGRRLADTDESVGSVFWLREYCAIVFMYTLDPPPSGVLGLMAPPSSWIAWGSKVDKTALLDSESILGVVCRMLTLEMEYEDEDDGQVEVVLDMGMEVDGKAQLMDHAAAVKIKAKGDSEGDEDMKSVQKEEALLRRLSSGLAFQSLAWRHANRWRQQHLELIESYADLMTIEWEFHVANLVGSSSTTKSIDKAKEEEEAPVSISFLVHERTIHFPDRACLSRASPFFFTLLQGDFLESTQQQIALQDVEPDDVELLLEILRESRMTAHHLLPEDMPFEAVVRLMVCADRFMVVFVRRLAENWILNALGELEMKEYNLLPMKASAVLRGGGNAKVGGLTTAVLDGSKRVRSDDGLEVGGEGVGLAEKRPRLDLDEDNVLVNEINLKDVLGRIIPSTGSHSSSSSTAADIASTTSSDTKTTTTTNNNNNNNNNNDNNDDHDNSSDDDKLSTPRSTTPKDDISEDEDPTTIQDTLLSVYEACSHPRLGSIYTTTHPFHGLLWDTLRRILLRMGSIATRPRFATMLNQGGEERIQEFLQILFELATDETDSYLAAADL
ncbi:hypothetical protein BGZ95_011810 [Linnemannia exigua]|uniref:BTB domain-containing protein n=1 Tax=Linnemannia exigua TaxID=604196 RepID=A0AAD4D9D9_9FUNG|nr:hypothetical protein BGZ95_011810 [Linnemannia exigua]